MFKLVLCSLVFGGYALASGGGGDYTPPVYYQYTYECKSPDSDLIVTMSAVGTGYYVPFTEITVRGIKSNLKVKFHTDNYYRYKTEERYMEASRVAPHFTFKGDFTLQENSTAKNVGGTAQYRDENHHIELFSNKNGSHSNTLEAFIYDLRSGSPIFNEKLKCSLKIESYEGK